MVFNKKMHENLRISNKSCTFAADFEFTHYNCEI